MSFHLDPIAASSRIERDYRSYLTTSFAPLDPVLQRDFVTALDEPARVRKGPYLQATPPYRPGATVADLVGEGLLHRDFLAAGDALPPKRPLYLHQETALRTAGGGSNMIVATGTGSGKTECYLLPILDQLLREREAGTLADPGVRALLLYPMNALANDQMKRIRELFAPYPDLTFGRYVGDTRHTPEQALDAYRQQMGLLPPAGELIDRKTMQERPPHVLLTNFAMLEYLLLRPNDTRLFDGPTGRHWRFVVLDEVHVYDGAKGAEVAMLLRRVRDRVNRSERGRLRCIGTSATLGRGVEDSESVAAFATTLFDEPFDPQAVVHPSRLPLRQADAVWSITPPALATLHDRWTAGAEPAELIRLAGRPIDVAGRTVGETLWALLHDESHVLDLQAALEHGAARLEDLTPIAPDPADPLRSLVQLVDLGVAARRDPVSAPLIPARYHLWLRASEGSFACLHPEHDPSEPRIRLDRFEHCVSCLARRVESALFELSVCRHCRRHLIAGRVVDDKVELPGARPSEVVYYAPNEVTADDAAVDEDEIAVERDDAPGGATRRVLCLGCRTVADRPTTCECSAPTWMPITQLNHPGEPVKRCPSCERRSNVGVALRFLSGSEAPVSVIATSLYQSLPPVSGASAHAVAGGRKLLMFSDSRQDAAFFAPYLDRTYSRALERRLVWQHLSSVDEPARYEDLVNPLRRHAERAGVLDADDGRKNRAAVMSWLLAEILATDRRQSLDGVALAEIGVQLPSRAEPPQALLDLGLDRVAGLDVVRVLLDTVRQSAAVTVPDEVNVREDQRFSPRNTTTWLRGTGSDAGVIAWVPTRGSNRRLDYLQRLAVQLGTEIDGVSVLRGIWDELTERNGVYSKMLPAHDPGKGLGTVYALDHERVAFTPAGPDARPYRCDVCRQVAWRNVLGVCPTYSCAGHLEPISEPEQNHYRSLYEGLEPLALTVQEHTGQLRTERAAELQERFTRGELNALSCSTTFELGVDVGEVQAVLMRNVPPTAANYVQRAGRAGRRLGSAALVVTFAQRRSHDRTFFDEPRAMIDGTVAAPYIAADNESIIRRHVHAVAYAQFERERVEAGAAALKEMGDLVAGEPGDRVVDEFVTWLRSHPSHLREALERIVPAEYDQVGVRTWAWVDALVTPDEHGVGGWLTALVDGLSHDLDELASLEEEAAGARQYDRSAVLKRAQQTLRKRRVLERFAQGGVLPKYGFPVDVVELDVSRTQSGLDLDLNRDLRLGILEFAPGAKVVAANKLWRSVGLKHMPGRELPVMHWGVCGHCTALRTQFAGGGDDDHLHGPCPHCGNDQLAPGRAGRFITPLFGFLGELDEQPPGETRPPREGHLETYFTEFDGATPPTEVVQLGTGRSFTVRISRRGWITVFNRGRSSRGFWYCSWCGHAQDSPPPRSKRNPTRAPHPRPTSGRDCMGNLSAIDLGHRFITNVLELSLPGLDGLGAESALQALIAAVPAIGIAENDVGGSVSVGEGGLPVLVLFDDVPGGAGHTRRIREQLDGLIHAAVERVGHCSCGEDTSCYGCLRSYRNQLRHDVLRRRAALDVLEPLL